MRTLRMIGIIIIVVIIAILLFIASNPILLIAEDTTESDPGIDMAASWTLTKGFEWVYPGSSYNSKGETLHNIHLDNPENPYGAAKEIMEYTYNFSPTIIISLNDPGASAIFGESILEDIRSNDAYNGYPGSENAQGNMSRGDAVSTAVNNDGINFLQIPIQILIGNIKFHFV